MAIWGAIVKPSSKDTSCKFIGSQLASSLLSSTGQLTNSVGTKLTDTLGKLKAGDRNTSKGIVDQSVKSPGKPGDKQSANPKRPGGLGILGLF